jgi:PAS domain S-box-containing protein
MHPETAQARTISLRRWSAAATAASTLVTTAALTAALLAVTGSRGQGRQLSQRLVPAAAGVDGLLDHYTAQQAALRDYVTTDRPAALATFRREGAALARQRSVVASLMRGYPGIPASLAAATVAYRAWLARVAGPQLAAGRLGDFARARARQADVAATRRYPLAVRAGLAHLQDWVTGREALVTRQLIGWQQILFGALIAVCVLAAVIAAGSVLVVRCWLLAPFLVLRRAAESVAAGRHATRIPSVGPTELAELGRSTELMRTRLVAALAGAERAEGKFRGLFDAAPDPTLTVTENLAIVMANAQAERLFGYTGPELAGRPLASLLPAAAGWPGSYLADLGPTPRNGRAVSAVARDGREFPVEPTVTALAAGSGLVGLVSLRDISERLAAQAEAERLRAEAQQERYERRLHQSQRLESLGQLVGGVAHDFNNLLTVITGFTDLLADQVRELTQPGPRQEPLLADLGQVQGAAQRSIKLTRQLLTFARRDVVHPQALDLNQVIHGVEHLLRRTLGEHIDLLTRLDPGLWLVEADSGQLDQVLINLAVNASDAMPRGGKLIIDTANITTDDTLASGHPSLAPGRYVRLRVSDNGTGMEPAVAARVFEPFFSTKPRGSGTGLGLATVHGIITQAGGQAQISSEPGLGTMVSALLPATDGAPVTGGGPAGPPAHAHARGQGQGQAILVAEDEPSLAQLVERILSRSGYRVLGATSPAAALGHVSDLGQPIDLLITDAVMPEMLGNELAARARAVRPGLPVLYMSGYAQPVLDVQGALDPQAELLEKPFSEAALLRRVHRALPGRPPAGEGAGAGRPPSG